MVEVLKKLGVVSGLIVLEKGDQNAVKSARNIPNVKPLLWEGLNVYDVMKYQHVVITRPALERVQEVLKP